VQLVGVALSFLVIMYFSMKRVSLGRVMFAATLIMALTSGIPAPKVWETLWSSFKDRTTLELAAAVLSIGVFSSIMQNMGFLDRLVAGLSGFLGDPKPTLMAVPALIGTMPVLGGAAVSAPLVDKLGDSLSLSPDRKAALNLVFRHGMFFVFPFSPGLILTSKITGFSVTSLISKLWPMSVAIWGIGYLALLRRVPDSPSLTRSREETSAMSTPKGFLESVKMRGSRFGEFLRYGAPLLIALTISLLLKPALWVALSIGSLLAVILGIWERKTLPSPQAILQGANLSQAVAMFWIMAFKSFVTISPVFPRLVYMAGTGGVSPVAMALLIPLVFGFGSASQTTTVGVLLPILVPADASQAARLYSTAIIYTSSFMAYFASPLHLCQVLTCQYFGIDISKAYRQYWPVLAGLFALVVSYALILSELS